MQTYTAKRVEILIEAPMESRLTAALMAAGVKGFSVLPVLGGAGQSGRWSADGQLGRAGMVAVICLVDPERLEPLLDAAFGVVERHIGLINVTEAQVIRKARF